MTSKTYAHTPFLRTVFAGIAGGAAGTTALNAVGYLDMLTRGRPSSDVPEQVVEKLADRAGVEIPGPDSERPNRVTALGALAGIAAGVGVGLAVALGRRAGLHAGLLVAGAAAGAAAMAASDTPIAALKVSDPRTWSRTDWLSDAIPHLAYGLAAVLVIRSVDRP